MGKSRQTILNVACSTAVLFINILVGFFLSPYIVKHIGVEANGFVSLANNFVAYANIIVAALNSMAARFITVAYVKKDYKGANLYYNSVFWGNLLVVAVLLIPAAYLVIRLENLVNIPAGIVRDVKWMFVFVFFNFFLITGVPNWDCGTYVTNRMDRYSVPGMVAALLRCIFLLLAFMALAPRVWYVGIASTLYTLVLVAMNGYNTYKLTPELKISFGKGRRICSASVIRELVGSGMWNSVSKVGNMFLSGMDLIICNLMLGAAAMGVLSLSKLLANHIQQFSAALRNVFAPELTINYAKEDKEAIRRDLNRGMKLTSVIMTIPIAGIAILGEEFFKLWVPSQDAGLLQTLSLLAVFGYVFTSGTQILQNVFETVNRVRENAVSMLFCGALSVFITILFIKFTDLGLYAVAGVSTFVLLLRDLCFTIPKAAKHLGFPWYQFFPQIAGTASSSLVLIALGYVIKPLLPSGSWAHFFLAAAVIGVIGLAVNIIVLLDKEERDYLFRKVSGKIRGRKK